LTESPGFLLTILAFVAVIGPLVFIHEMGHYLVARWFGVHAEVFSIGFGKELMAWTDKGGTRWRVAAIPLGGYVKFAGDLNAASATDPDWLLLPPEERKRTFAARPVSHRAAIVAAGPLANFLFAGLILAGFAVAYGENVAPPVIHSVKAGSAAAAGGIKPGDRIVRVDAVPIDRFEDLSRAVSDRPGKKAAITLVRDGNTRTISMVIGVRAEQDRFGNIYKFGMLGVMSNKIERRPVSLLEAPVVATRQTVAIVGMMADGLMQIVTGRRSLDEVGGFVRIAQMSGEQAARGPEPFILFIALISINLGFINLLPIPVLDGGHLLFQGLEALQRRPVSIEIQNFAYRSGFALLMAVVLLVNIKDVIPSGLWKSLFGLIG
jgi:regulator of sigma E protease